MNEPSPSAPKSNIKLFTIGFAGKSAEQFFDTLRQAGVKCLIDVRLNNVSQLAGFTKKKDLQYFLRTLADIDYRHEADLAPTKEILDDYKKGQITWDEYEQRFQQLLGDRRPTDRLKPQDLDKACLLCSEPKAVNCHRRLVAEHFEKEWGNVDIQHL